VDDAAKMETAEAHGVFDDAKDRFNSLLAFGVVGFGIVGLPACPSWRSAMAP
jgi:hypothetical protein